MYHNATRTIYPLIRSNVNISGQSRCFKTRLQSCLTPSVVDKPNNFNVRPIAAFATYCTESNRRPSDRSSRLVTHSQWTSSSTSSDVIARQDIGLRSFHTGLTNNCNKNQVQTQEQLKNRDAAEDVMGAGADLRSISPTNFDKRILVWTGRYPSKDDIPPLVSDTILNGAKNKFRVYVNIFMALATFTTAMFVMRSGRRRSARGESVSRLNMVRHPNQYKEHLDANPIADK